MKTLAVLFADVNGPYSFIEEVDLWTDDRDARLYNGSLPVIAHPPCGRWCSMAVMNERRWGSKVGDDEGCFEAALSSVRRCRGILEHPADSIAWKTFNLSSPCFGEWIQSSEKEWVTEVWQSSYGHVARKRTWLLYCGDHLPFELNWMKFPGMFQIGGGINTGNNQLPRCPDSLTHITPFPFAVELMSLATFSRDGLCNNRRFTVNTRRQRSNVKVCFSLDMNDI